MTFANVRPGQEPTMECPKCGGNAVYDRRSILKPLFHHVYRCLNCREYIARPAEYMKCERFGLISMDLLSADKNKLSGAHDCQRCPLSWSQRIDRENMSGGCKFFKGPAEYDFMVDEMKKREVKFIEPMAQPKINVKDMLDKLKNSRGQKL